ncbi:MAG: carbohydrate ABC transporter permease, partial [Ornithinimicrobium sp.]
MSIGTESAKATSTPAVQAVGDNAGNAKKILFYAVLTFFALLYIFPFIIQLSTSFKTDAQAVNDGLSLWPNPFTLDAYRTLADTDFPIWFANSVVVTLFVTVGRVFFCSMAGYALARLSFLGREALFTGLLAVLAVPAIVLLIPKFLMLNYLGIYNTYPALFVPLLVDAAGIFIMK